MQYLTFCFWAISFNMMISGFLYFPVWLQHGFILLNEYIYIFFIYSSVDVHLLWIALQKHADIGTSLYDTDFVFRNMLSSSTAESNDISTFSFSGTSILISCSTNSHFHPQCRRSPFFLHILIRIYCFLFDGQSDWERWNHSVFLVCISV